MWFRALINHHLTNGQKWNIFEIWSQVNTQNKRARSKDLTCTILRHDGILREGNRMDNGKAKKVYKGRHKTRSIATETREVVVYDYGWLYKDSNQSIRKRNVKRKIQAREKLLLPIRTRFCFNFDLPFWFARALVPDDPDVTNFSDSRLCEKLVDLLLVRMKVDPRH